MPKNENEVWKYIVTDMGACKKMHFEFENIEAGSNGRGDKGIIRSEPACTQSVVEKWW